MQEPKQETADAGDVHNSSNDMILYTPPASPTIKKKKKQIAKFVMRTVGLKTRKDTDKVKEGNMKSNRTFKCYLCGEQFGSTRKMNIHFKIDHEGLDCIECSKGFNSPLSLKKHSYVHKLCNFNCTRCKKTFPFKSQRDFHEKVHDKLRFSCTRESCWQLIH